MNATSLTHFHNNYTKPIFEGIHLPFGLEPVEVQDFKHFPYKDYKTNIVLFRLSGEKQYRKQELSFVRKAMNASKNFVFLIMTPFSFEKGVDLGWVHKQLDKIHEKHQNFELLDMESWLQEKPHFTFDQAFKSVQQVISLVCAIYYGTFKG